MWMATQKILINEFCDLAGLTKSREQILQTGILCCNDVVFTLLPSDASDAMRIFVQLGMPPEKDVASAYRRLLELNLLLPLQHAWRLAIDPETGMAIFCYQLQVTDGAQLLASLQLAAARALEWRTDYFFTDDVIALEGQA